MQAILSDIHGNLEALNEVLAHIHRHRVDTIINLGDTVGYGPNPYECVELAHEMDVVLLGNHDRALLWDPDGIPPSAERALQWTGEEFQRRARPEDEFQPSTFLEELPRSWLNGDALYVHGSPRNPLHEYLFPEDIYNHRKMDRIEQYFDCLCFAGHTHVPGIFYKSTQRGWEYLSPEECSDGFSVVGREKVICNVGSVGQPRDGNPAASYVLFDGEVIRFQRVPYDYTETMMKMRANPMLEDFLADRLAEGR